MSLMAAEPGVQLGGQRLADTIAVYNETAERYAANWDDVLHPDLVAMAAGLRAGAVILDAGCGPGRDLASWQRLGMRAVGVDLSPAMVSLATGRGLRAVCGDLRSLAFPNACFDAVWAMASLVHLDLEDTGRALRELFRVAVPGAVGYASVKHRSLQEPIEFAEGGRWFRGWLLGEFSDVARAAGWEISSAGVEPDVGGRPNVRWCTLRLSRPRSPI